MEKAGLPVYGVNDKYKTFVILSNTKTLGIRDIDAYQKPIDGQKTITLKELILKLLPQNRGFNERSLRSFIKRVQEYAGNGRKKPLAYLTSFSFQLGHQDQAWEYYDFRTKSTFYKYMGAAYRGMKCLYMAKDMLISWKHSLNVSDKDGLFLNEIKELFKEPSLYEAVSVSKDQNWAFLIYAYDRKDISPGRHYPSESDYAASCRVYQNKMQGGKKQTFIDFKTLDLYGPLKTEYDGLNGQEREAITKRTID